jgi:hypothetical protein
MLCDVNWYLSGGFANLRKTHISFVVASARPSVCLSVRPRRTTRLPLDGFWWNMIFERFSEICRKKFKFYWYSKRITGTLQEDVFTFITISLWFLLRMRSISNESCTENRNTHFVFSNVFQKIVPFMRKCGKIWWSHRGCRWQYGGALHAEVARLHERKHTPHPHTHTNTHRNA